MFPKILLVMVGGSIGAFARYAVTLAANKLFGPKFPWGTLTVNLVGCFLIGLAFALADRSSLMGPRVRMFFVTGFLGALTTFSTFALESVNNARDGLMPIATANFLANNIGGLALVLVGMWVAEAI